MIIIYLYEDENMKMKCIFQEFFSTTNFEKIKDLPVSTNYDQKEVHDVLKFHLLIPLILYFPEKV